MNTRRSAFDGVPAIELVEEAVHLLRQTSPGALAIYYSGTAPFVLGFLFFWARVTWFRPSDAAVAWAALGLVALFAWMKVAQAEFCARLLAQRLGDAPPRWSVARLRSVASAQLRWQTWGILVLPATLVVAVPFGWVYAFFQSASAIGSSERMGADTAEQAQLWPGQNHLGLLILAAFSAAVWLNVAVAFWFVPWLANRLLGIENLFGFSGWWIFNTTFLAATVGLAWLAVDPLVKAFYTLRVFYGRSRRNGEDLRVELKVAQRSRRGLRSGVLVALALWSGFFFEAEARAAETTGETRVVQAAELDAAIDEVLAGSEFEWRLRPVPGVEEAGAQDGWLKAFARTAVEWLRDFFRWLVKVWRDLRDWVDDLFPSRREADESSGAAVGWAAMQVLLWGAIVLVVGLIVSVVVLAWRRSRQYRRPAIAARAVSMAAPDLRDEATQAAQLPADGWVALAREQLARSEWRLALRALYLGTLAKLAAEGLVSLAKFKTNLDYERELRRRALARQETVAWFAARRLAFEAVWYGRAVAGEVAAREWLAELERRSTA